MRCNFIHAKVLVLLFAFATIAASGHRIDTDNEEPDGNGESERIENEIVTPHVGHRDSHKNTSKPWSCAKTDYKSYVKCLQRRRRHDASSGLDWPAATAGGGGGSSSSTCVQECEYESCRHSRSRGCAEICRDRCFKKTKEIHHTITEYENACSGENCDRSKFGNAYREFGPHNLTTSVDIRNYLNNTNVIVTGQGDRESRKNDGGPGSGPGSGNGIDGRGNGMNGQGNGINGNGINGNGMGRNPSDGGFNYGVASNPNKLGYGGGYNGGGGDGGDNNPANRARQFWYPSPNLALVPQVQLVPQISLGLGVGLGLGIGAAGGGLGMGGGGLAMGGGALGMGGGAAGMGVGGGMTAMGGGGCLYPVPWPCYPPQPPSQQTSN